MIPVPVYHQPSLSNSCLPTCVCAVLRYLQIGSTQQEVSTWCRETEDGCNWYEAMEGLGEEFEVEDVADNWKRIIELVETEGLPVVVTIGNVLSVMTQQTLDDHAVVIVEVTAPGKSTSEVVCMNPATGTIERMPSDRFQFGWQIPGGKAFAISG